jgi:DNA-binding CsgD family transcriptional regulator
MLWVRARSQLGREEWLLRGSVGEFEQAGLVARRLGMTIVEQDVLATRALHEVLCGRFDDAARIVRRCRSNGDRRLVEYVLAAHQAHQARPARQADRPDPIGVQDARLIPLRHGLADAFRALLEENRDAARAELDAAIDSESVDPAPLPLTGRYGLTLLLDALAGDLDLARWADVAAAHACTLRWNRQFVLLAEAVLLGREQAGEEATSAVVEAGRVAAPYGMARHLGLRLVAEAACVDGWGDPASWLRTAADHFRDGPGYRVALACDGLLRQLDAAQPGPSGAVLDVPDVLRSAGVTGREYEVLRLLVDRLSNRAIAKRLHISPRTVEKHVAQLLRKTCHQDRVVLGDFAAKLAGGAGAAR